MADFLIMFGDLCVTSQEELCRVWATTPGDENWDIQPLAIITREDEPE